MADSWAQSAPQLAWHCEFCKKPTLMTILDRWWIRPDDDDNDPFDPFERVAARCTSCQMPYILGQDDGFCPTSTPLTQIFPEPDRQLPSHVPQSVRDAHEEALKCNRTQSYTAATLMARRGIEAICSDKGATGRNLYDKLTDLHTKGVIDQALLDWSSVIRTVGNQGAHGVDKPPTREDARDVIAFLEAIISYLYTFRLMYENYQERLAASDMPETPTPPAF